MTAFEPQSTQVARRLIGHAGDQAALSRCDRFLAWISKTLP